MHDIHSPCVIFPGICLASYKGHFQTHADMDVAYDARPIGSCSSASVLPAIDGGQGHQEGAASTQFVQDHGSSRAETESDPRLTKLIRK